MGLPLSWHNAWQINFKLQVSCLCIQTNSAFINSEKALGYYFLVFCKGNIRKFHLLNFIKQQIKITFICSNCAPITHTVAYPKCKIMWLSLVGKDMSPVCFWMLSELQLETDQDCKEAEWFSIFLLVPSLKLNPPGSHTACSKLPARCSSCGKTLCDAYFYCI